MTYLTETADYWIVPVKGREVTRCSIDYGFSIEFWSSSSIITIRIEQNFKFTDGQEIYILSVNQPSTLGVALQILHKVVKSVLAYKSGKLQIVFSDELEIEVDSDTDYEAWQIDESSKFKIVSVPGDNLVIWQY